MLTFCWILHLFEDTSDVAKNFHKMYLFVTCDSIQYNGVTGDWQVHSMKITGY